MAGYVRRFTFDPGDDVLLNIESINILDLEPPGALRGIGTGTVLCVGEFENGPYNFPLEVSSGDDLVSNFGSLGFVYNSVQANNPCAIARHADGASAAEFWNGNAFVQLNGKQFSRLILCRPNTSVGSVQFTKIPSVTGAPGISYPLQPGQAVQLDVGAGPQTATFSAAAGTTTSAGAGYGVNPGDTVTLGYDGAPNFTVTFLAGDASQAAVIARVNQYAGFAFAATAAAGQWSLTGIQKGNQGQVRIVASSTPGVLTALGFSVSTVLGTGNVANIGSVTQLEAQTVIQAAVANTLVQFDSQSRIRVSNTSPATAPYIQVLAGTTATAFGLAVGQLSAQQGQAVVVSSPVTLPPNNLDTVTLGIDAQPNVVVTFGGTETTITLLIARINAAFAAANQPAVAFADGAGNWYLASPTLNSTASQVRVVSTNTAAVLSKIGMQLGTTSGAGGPLGVLPAGTVVQVPGTGPLFVTAQDVNFTPNGVLVGGKTTASGGVVQTTAGPWSVPIRHALDDGSGAVAAAGAITQITTVPDVFGFTCVNLQATSAALTEGQIDAAYVAALNATLDVNTVAKQANVVFAARQSTTVRLQLRSNALTASGNGCFGRMACVRPPLNTPKQAATGIGAPGVTATRDRRVIYCYIGSNVFVPLISRRGVAGNPAGTGYTAFTADGNVDVGSDSLMASVLSQLPPEENPGQDTPFTSAVNGIERGPNVQGFQMSDYINFKAAGIAALRVDDGVASFQSGVTSVDPGVNPNLANISRQRMSDYINDSIAQRGKGYSKKLMTVLRRKAFAKEVKQFLEGLLSQNNPAGQRIAGLTVDSKSNTAARLGSGMFRLRIFVQTLSSMDSIVIESVIGSQVTTQEVFLPLAA